MTQTDAMKARGAPALRRLTPLDADSLRALRIEAFTTYPREFRSTPDEEAATPVAQLGTKLADDYVVGLFDGEALVGAAGLSLPARAKGAHRGEIWGVYVRAGQRGRAGERLLTALLQHAQGRCEAVQLAVSDGNRAALRLYTRLGFVPWAFDRRALKLPDGTFVDEVLMVKPMDGGAASSLRIAI